MSDKKVICPICDEEFDSIEAVPEKCPVCETRKQEIIQDLKDKEEGQITTFMVKDHASKVKEASEIKEIDNSTLGQLIFMEKDHASKVKEASEIKEIDNSTLGQVIVDEMVEDEESVDESIIFKEDKKLSEEPSKKSDYIEKNKTFVDDEEISVLFVEEEDNIKDLVSIQRYGATLDDSLENYETNQENIEKDVIFDEKNEDVIFDEEDKDVIFDEESKKIDFEEKEKKAEIKEKKIGFLKSGASSLEKFPIGFKYCLNCNESFPIDFKESNCNICNEPLKIYEKGFQPGHYLILYNDIKKAIGYFRLDNAGSIIIGRSSERGSPYDIDVSLAWKNFYKRNYNEEDFKEKMKLVKGLSRKHALIRYLKEESKYVLFHLSNKNYSIAYFPDGKKKQKGPNQRSPIYLESDALISFGNSTEHITLKFKKVELPK